MLPDMVRLAQASGNQEITLEAARARFWAAAPEELDVATRVDVVPTSLFAHRQGMPSADAARSPQISCVLTGADVPSGVLLCDMRRGEVRDLHGTVWVVAEGVVDAELVDVDGDGDQDLVTAHIGALQPSLTQAGAITLHRRDGGGLGPPEVLLDGLGRVARLCTGDVDGDASPEIAAAEFGHEGIGAVWLIRSPGERPQAVAVDRRGGAVDCALGDLDGDGRDELVVAMAQHLEQIVVWRADAGVWSATVLFEAPTPAWGTTSVHIADVDRDGRLDVLHTNGDVLDSFEFKPFHGVRWHDNRGDLGEARLVMSLPGAVSVRTGDADGDGFTDIVAAAWVHPLAMSGRARGVLRYETLALALGGPDGFEHTALDAGGFGYVGLAFEDVDHDGRSDVLAGRFLPLPDDMPRPANRYPTEGLRLTTAGGANDARTTETGAGQRSQSSQRRRR